MVKILLHIFRPFLISPQNCEYFEYRHIGSTEKKFPPPYAQNKIYAKQDPLFCTTMLRAVQGGGGGEDLTKSTGGGHWPPLAPCRGCSGATS